MKRNLRPRCAGQYVSQQEWEMEGQAEDDFILGRRYNVLDKFHSIKYQTDHGFVKEMDGEDFDLKYIQENGFKHSVVFHNPASLGMRMPSQDLTVADIKKLVGSRRKVDVIDTLTQDSTMMSLGQWTKYYQTFPRQRLLNIISLEISCTKLDSLVNAPDMVRELDWVEQVWPQELKDKQTNPTNDLNKMMYPKVQKYCLMSVAGCYTDFHLDFGGTSVWYHVLKGEKQFLLIPPSTTSLSLFQQWQMSGEQESMFLADLMDKAQLVHLHAGDTFMMPAGWIHAVYTPSDSIVFGGNFLHSFNIAQQLLVAEVERNTKVPLRLCYPFYGSIHWYVLSKYAQELRKFIVKKNKGRSCSTAESDSQRGSPVNCGQQWLKEVAIKKCSILPSTPPPGPRCDVQDITVTVAGTSFPDAPVGCNSECSKQPIEFTDTAAMKSVIPGEAGDVEYSLRFRLPSPTLPKPHFSNHERGGLLVLVQKMKNKLFQPDVPISITSSSDLLKDIEDLLHCAMSEKTSSLEPSGVGILAGRKNESLQRHTRKRMRKHSVENHKTKPKIRKVSHVDTSATSSINTATETKQDTTSDTEMLDYNPDISETELCSSSASSPSVFTATAVFTPPKYPSPMSASYTAEVMLAIDSAYSPATSFCPCDDETETVVLTDQCCLEPVGGLQLASSPTALHTEATITRLPNPAFINC